MKKLIFVSTLLASALFAQSSKVSDFDLDSQVKEISNELGYGKKSKYSLLFAKHSFTLPSDDVHFYYGAKMGFVSEEYATDNGFGLPLNKIGAYYAAAVGIECDLGEKAVLLAEGVRAEDQALQVVDNQLQVTYTYNY